MCAPVGRGTGTPFWSLRRRGSSAVSGQSTKGPPEGGPSRDDSSRSVLLDERVDRGVRDLACHDRCSTRRIVPRRVAARDGDAAADRRSRDRGRVTEAGMTVNGRTGRGSVTENVYAPRAEQVLSGRCSPERTGRSRRARAPKLTLTGSSGDLRGERRWAGSRDRRRRCSRRSTMVVPVVRVLQHAAVGRVDDRRADLRRRPVGMLLAHDGGRAREVRGRHRRALEERPARRRRLHARQRGLRAEHVHARGDDVRLDPEVDVGRALAAEAGHDVVVRRLEVRQFVRRDGRRDRRCRP